jgi:glutathione synthase/RimK-type ligase-like ATP-grasp enzyme
MNSLLVVSQSQDWVFELPHSPDSSNIRVVTAQTYLAQPENFDYRDPPGVINLGAAGDYQSAAYYVSLLAEARGHQPLPSPDTLATLAAPALLQWLTEPLLPLLQSTLAAIDLDTDVIECRIYFGRTPAPQWAELAARLFALLPAPLLRVRAERHARGWQWDKIGCIDCGAVPALERSFMHAAAGMHLRHKARRASSDERIALAILHDPEARERPSNTFALQKFIAAAEQCDMRAEMITRKDLARLPQFHGLFIRDTTHVNHYTYGAARQAELQGVTVIDDSSSILKCCNKLYLADLLARHRIRQPRSLLVQRDTLEQIIPALGLPCVLKQPDGAFSRGIVKVGSKQALLAGAAQLLKQSSMILAQEYLPTEFDWRIGILDRQPLFACRYFMVPGHWQIVKADRQSLIEGKTEALPVATAPQPVVQIALQAANLIGDGFYGVDVKERNGECYVMEINDNPNIDAGHEDHVLQDELYRAVMAVFRRRIEAARNRPR